MMEASHGVAWMDWQCHVTFCENSPKKEKNAEEEENLSEKNQEESNEKKRSLKESTDQEDLLTGM